MEYVCEKCGQTYKNKKWFRKHKCKPEKIKHYNQNNKYAETWTREVALKFFEDSYEILKKDKEIVFIGTLASEMNSYRDVYVYLIKKFPDKEFRTIYKKINALIESRLFHGALNNNYNSTIAKLGLTYNHKWVEKNEDKEPIDGTIELE